MATKAEIQRLIDESIEHDRELQKKSAAIALFLIALMDSSEGPLRLILQRYLAELTQPGVNLSSPIIQARIEQMRAEVTNLRLQYVDIVRGRFDSDVDEVIDGEWEWLVSTYAAAGIPLTLPAGVGGLRADIRSTPFLGRDLDQWITDLGTQDSKRIMDAVVIGLIQAQTEQAILEAVLGTADANGTDGATQITRNNLKSIVDSSLVSMAAQARNDLTEANDENVPRQLYVAVLDSRTTQICRSFHGKVFKVGEGPIPPLHWNCRSTRVPLPADGDIPPLT